MVSARVSLSTGPETLVPDSASATSGYRLLHHQRCFSISSSKNVDRRGAVVRSMVSTLRDEAVENGFDVLDVIERKRRTTGCSVLRPLVTYKTFPVFKGHIRNEMALGPSLNFCPSFVDVRRKSRVYLCLGTGSRKKTKSFGNIQGIQ